MMRIFSLQQLLLCGIRLKAAAAAATGGYRHPIIRSQLGFTLAELMTVISIIALAATIASPIYFSWLPRYRLRHAALELFANYQRARMLAIRNGSEVAVVFKPEAGIYQIVSGGTNGRYDGFLYPSDDVVTQTVRLSDYGSDVAFGHGDALKNATSTADAKFPADGISYNDNIAKFNGEGLSNIKGHVYLTNCRRSAFAVATPTMAGTVRLLMWNGLEWE
ncbi:MAG: prepilin-type N-terminal cleavage/methylation domain-containing protein [Thermodesulfobacteriota bacterium]